MIENMSLATLPDDLSPLDEASVLGAGRDLSVLQRAWARHYVANGGRPIRAAEAAGYAHASARISASNNCINPKVMAYVRQLVIGYGEAALPLAMRAHIRMIVARKTDDRARIQAITALYDRFGMAVQKGPSVQVNLQVNGSQAQGIITEVWKERAARLGITVSDIDDAMSDIPQMVEGQVRELATPAAAEAGGGVASPGSPAADPAHTSPLRRSSPKSQGAGGGAGNSRSWPSAAGVAVSMFDDDGGVGGGDWAHPGGLRGAMLERERGEGHRAVERAGKRDAGGGSGGGRAADVGGAGTGSATDAWRRATAGRAEHGGGE